jgi:hypothetical protein
VDHVDQLGREEGHSQVEDAVAEADGRHEPPDGLRRDQPGERGREE